LGHKARILQGREVGNINKERRILWKQTITLLALTFLKPSWTSLFARQENIQHTVGSVPSCPNNKAGIIEVVTQLKALKPKLIVMEATGGFEVPLASALATAQLPLVVANPRQIRDFAKATGRLAKTEEDFGVGGCGTSESG
jgi:hypothetical protein